MCIPKQREDSMHYSRINIDSSQILLSDKDQQVGYTQIAHQGKVAIYDYLVRHGYRNNRADILLHRKVNKRA